MVFLTQSYAQKPNNALHYEFIEGSEGQVYNFSQIEDELILNHHKGAFTVNGNRLDKFHDIGSWKFV